MGFNVQRDSSVTAEYGEDDGFAWFGVTGGEGTTAVSAGAIPVLRVYGSSTFAAEPFDTLVVTKPSASDSAYMLVGVRIPQGVEVGIRDRWVIYWEED
jgi:hypothetical protein